MLGSVLLAIYRGSSDTELDKDWPVSWLKLSWQMLTELWTSSIPTSPHSWTFEPSAFAHMVFPGIFIHFSFFYVSLCVPEKTFFALLSFVNLDVCISPKNSENLSCYLIKSPVCLPLGTSTSWTFVGLLVPFMSSVCLLFHSSILLFL